MPVCCFMSPDMKRKTSKHFSMADAPDHMMIDGERWERDFRAEAAGGQQPSTWPMTSNALAVHPTQRQQYSEFASNSGVPTDFDKAGKPIFHSKSHRRRYCNLVGATDFDGGYGDPRSD